MERTLQHWGIKGMRWGIRRYQNKDGSLTPAGKKRREQEIADAEEAKRQREEAKQKAIKSGTATEVMKFRGELDARELQTALDRIDREQRLKEISAKELASGKSQTDKFFDGVGKATKYAEIGIKAWNTIANIHNGLSLNGKTWAKIDVDVNQNNKKLRKAEKAAKDAEEKKAREKADKEAAEAKAEKEKVKAEKARQKAEKKVDDEIDEKIRKSEEAERQRKEQADFDKAMEDAEIIGEGTSRRKSSEKSKTKRDYETIIADESWYKDISSTPSSNLPVAVVSSGETLALDLLRRY